MQHIAINSHVSHATTFFVSIWRAASEADCGGAEFLASAARFCCLSCKLRKQRICENIGSREIYKMNNQK